MRDRELARSDLPPEAEKETELHSNRSVISRRFQSPLKERLRALGGRKSPFTSYYILLRSEREYTASY